MAKVNLGVAAVSAALLLVGAGCGSAPATTTGTETGSTAVTTNNAMAGAVTKEAMTGTWKGVSASFDEITLNADGSFTSVYGGKPFSKGTWAVENSQMVLHDPDYVVDGTYSGSKLDGDKFTGKNTSTENDDVWERVK